MSDLCLFIQKKEEGKNVEWFKGVVKSWKGTTSKNIGSLQDTKTQAQSKPERADKAKKGCYVDLVSSESTISKK